MKRAPLSAAMLFLLLAPNAGLATPTGQPPFPPVVGKQPLDERVRKGLDQPAITQDGSDYVALGARHASRFDGRSLQMTQRRAGLADGPTARYELLEMRKGSTVLTTAADALGKSVRGSAVEYMRRAGIVERYEVLGMGVEQSFVLPRPISVAGDLIITGTLSGDTTVSEPVSTADGGLTVTMGGQTPLRFGRVTVIDAANNSWPAKLAGAGSRITITVDGARLATANYPVTVDPFILIEVNTLNQSRPAVALDMGYANDQLIKPRYLVVYEEVPGGGAMTRIVGRFIDAVTGTSTGPFVISDNTPVHNYRPSVANKWGPIFSREPARDFMVAWHRSDGKVVNRVVSKSGALLSPVLVIDNSGADVDVAGDPWGNYTGTGCNATVSCSTWVAAYRQISTGTAPADIIRVATLWAENGLVDSRQNVEFMGSETPLHAPTIRFGRESSANNYMLAYKRDNGSIVMRKVAIGAASIGAPTSTGAAVTPPRLAFSYGDGLNRWAVIWQEAAGGFLGGYQIKGAVFENGTGTTVPFPASVTGTTSPLVESDYDIVGTVTKLPDMATSFFEVSIASYSSGGRFKLYSGRILSNATWTPTSGAGGAPAVTLSPQVTNKDNRYPRLAAGNKTLVTQLVPTTCDGGGLPGDERRCALWVWEHSYSTTDHDIYGYLTQTHY